MKILIADDDAVSRSMMRRLLTQSGFEVLCASDGIEAVQTLAWEDGPRLLLLDWMMPGLDGPEVCRAIRTAAREAYIYIILLTSKDSKDDIIAGLEAGADDYLTKPCHPDELRARLRTGERILQLEDILVKAREEMRFRATHDGLTHLLNRTSVIQRLEDDLARVHRHQLDFSVVICDVDYFKKINDNHGHPVGDEVLREVANRLQKAVRAGDAVGRYGGEEFLLVLNGCTAEGLGPIAASICEAIRSTPVSTSAGPLSISISAGALHVGVPQSWVTTGQVLHTADVALYESKTSGRDRFTLTWLDEEILAVA